MELEPRQVETLSVRTPDSGISILAISTSRQWKLHHLYICNAFLNGNGIHGATSRIHYEIYDVGQITCVSSAKSNIRSQTGTPDLVFEGISTRVWILQLHCRLLPIHQKKQRRGHLRPHLRRRLCDNKELRNECLTFHQHCLQTVLVSKLGAIIVFSRPRNEAHPSKYQNNPKKVLTSVGS